VPDQYTPQDVDFALPLPARVGDSSVLLPQRFDDTVGTSEPIASEEQGPGSEDPVIGDHRASSASSASSVSFEAPEADLPISDDQVAADNVPVEVPDRVVDSIERLTAEVLKSHERAAHREAVIDALHGELETLRRGERRSLLRPLLTGAARLRNDLLRQAETLPDDFDASRASQLLLSFADSVELMLEDNGVAIEMPFVGHAFEPRRQRAIGKVETFHPALAGTIVEVTRAGVTDVDSGAILAHAEVRVYVFDPSSIPDDQIGEAQSDPDGAEE